MPATDENEAPPLTESQQEWLRVRAYLQERRHELSTVAADLYPDLSRVAGTPLLTVSAWHPDKPAALQSLELQWSADGDGPGLMGVEPVSAHLRPTRPNGDRYPSYSAAMKDLAAPGMFQNRTTYRLKSADLAGRRCMDFEPGTYFDGINVGEACAHELAAARLGLLSATPLRDAVGNPCEPAHRPTNVAISALTLRHDQNRGEASFPLHWRDPAKVGHAGGLYMVMPVGIFQASGDEPWHQLHDLSLWRCLIREYSEELLGEDEKDAGEVPINYDAWPFAVKMSEALANGRIRAYCLGMGVDPLTFATDVLTAVVLEAELFDDLFGAMVDTNTEGRVVTSDGGGRPSQSRFPFTQDTVERLTRTEPLQAAGAALLRLAWRHSERILSNAP
jgi:hypothetical protein